MNSELLNEGYFNNPNISYSEKLGLVSLLSCGSMETQMGALGKESTFVSLCPKKGGGTQFIAFTYGRPDSLNEMSVKTILHSIGYKDSDLFNQNDKAVIETVVKNSTLWANVSPFSSKSRYEDIVKQNVDKYFDNLIKSNPYLADNPQIVASVKNLIEQEFTKTITKHSSAEENGKKND